MTNACGNSHASHRPLVSIQLCLVLPPPSSFRCIWNCPHFLLWISFPGVLWSPIFRGFAVSAVFVWQCCQYFSTQVSFSSLSWSSTGFRSVFTARAYARAVLGVVILSVRLSVTRVHCNKTKWRTADIFILHKWAITLLLWHQQWLVGDAPFPLKSALKVTHPPSKNTDFDRFPLITSQP